jgi:Fur family zinc uptake transcriptional regulator
MPGAPGFALRRADLSADGRIVDDEGKMALANVKRNVITLRYSNARRNAAMTLESIEPGPCAVPDCRQHHAPGERVALALSLCSARGAHLTDLRRQILELLWQSGRPTGAYDLIEALKRRDSRSVGPPTVYRALEFLMSQGLVAKIESRNAYVPCTHPERQHDCLFFICRKCGASAELEDPQVGRLLSEQAASIGFRPTRRVVEVEGICARCVAAGAA